MRLNVVVEWQLIPQQKTYTFHVSGTHCSSCKILIESILNEEDFVKNAKVNLKHETVEISTDSLMSQEELAQILTEKIKPNGYTLSADGFDGLTTGKLTKDKQNGHIIWQALPIGLIFLTLFFLLQRSGILNLGLGGQITPATSFIIGLIASVSSCLAIVGGLVLSLSAKISQDNVSDTKTFILFHMGRLVSFAVLGGVLGLVGSAIGINFTFSAILGFAASVVMLFLGLNLIGVFAKNKIFLPSGIFDFFRKIEHRTLTPLIIGFGTFFLPCGFTQSMQVSALSSGSFISGFLIMFSFALGTLPMLVLLSFGSASFAHGKHAPLFFKSAGVVVVGLGMFALFTGLAGLGIINPLFNI
ncbi:MAG: sulfite exporter TauE/SafE family protein [Patescibacteria group bacterium]|nr:sulfite exporter TauE/SafE family protein [Patescibacteria group bacterium]